MKKKVPGCKCKICGRSLRGVFLRYGAEACSACASFFVRSLDKRRIDYFCGNNNMCLKTVSEVGAECQKCRFQKCIDIGMTSPALTKYKNNVELNSEYFILAKKLDAIFVICTENPQILLNHLVLGDIKILEESKTLSEAMHGKFAYLETWTKIFQSNQIEINKIHILFYSVICNIQFPWLSTPDQDLLIEAQQKSILQHLQFSTYSNNKEMKECFDRLTIFFQNQYHKLFGLKKLQNSGN